MPRQNIPANYSRGHGLNYGGRENNDPAPAQRNFVNDQPDQGSINFERTQMRGGMLPFDEVLKILNARNIPPQVRQTPYYVTFTSTTDIKLVIPANPQRMGFIFGFVSPALTDTDFVMLSYGPPPTRTAGLPIPHLGSFQEGNGTVSIDDLYINPNFVADATFPFTIAAFEAVLAVESHLHQQTSSG